MAKRRSVVAGWDPTYVNPDTSTGRPKGVQTVSDMRTSLTYDILGEGVFATKGVPEITGSPTNIATISPFMAAIESPAGGYYTPSTTADENIEINLLNVGAVKIYVQQKDYEVDNAAVDSEVVFGVVYGATAIPEGALLLFTSTLSGQTSTSLMTFTPAFKYTGQASGMIRVPSVADLENITSIQNGTHGFVIDGDGIGEYIYDSVSESWPAVTGTTNGVVINVKDFGALGNGVADDTVEIQAAVDAASAAGGGEVFFPRGLYVISASIKLKSSVNMTGVGMSNGGSTNLAASKGTTIKQITTSEDGFYLEANGAAAGYIRIEDMSILGAGYSTSTKSGININQVTDHTILHVYISAVTVRGFGLWGISAEALINSVIEKCLVAYNGNGINVFGRAGWPTTSTVVRNNYLNWNLGIGVRFNYTDYSSIVENASDHQDIHYQIGDCTNVTVSANGAEWNDTDAPANGIGYDIWGSRYVTMDSNFILNNKNIALRVRSSPTYASTNLIVRNFRNAIPVGGTTGLDIASGNFMVLDGNDIGGGTIGTITGTGIVYDLSALYKNIRINGAGDAIYSVKHFIPRDNLAYALGDGTHKWNSLNVGTITTTYGTGITFASGSSLVFDEGGAGTKFGTSTTQKLGFWNTTPVSQRSGNILTALSSVGLVVSPTIAQADITNLVSDLALKAPLASPALTGVPTVPTATAGTNTTQAASTAFVSTAVANLIDSSPAALDTLNELAAALGDDPNYATTTATLIGTKAPIESPTFTGTVSGITKAMVGLGNAENTTDLNKPVSTATQTALDAKLSLAGGTLTGTLNARDVIPSSGGVYALGSSVARYLTGFFSAINLSGSTGIVFNTNNSSAIGSSSAYASNVFGVRHTFNTTAFIDGATAGQMTFTGHLAAASNYGSDLGTAGGAFATVRAGVFRADYAVGLAFAAGSNIQMDTATGTKIGTATAQKIGFWNATPVVQQVLATGASHTVDDVITLLQTLGLVKQS